MSTWGLSSIRESPPLSISSSFTTADLASLLGASCECTEWVIISAADGPSNISFAAFQYERHGTVTLGMIGVNVLQLVYVVGA